MAGRGRQGAPTDPLGRFVTGPRPLQQLGGVAQAQGARGGGERGTGGERLEAPPRPAVAEGSVRIDGHVPKLRVLARHAAQQRPSEDGGAADSGAEGQHDHGIEPPARTRPALAQQSHVGVVLEDHRTSQGLSKGAHDVSVYPAGAACEGCGSFPNRVEGPCASDADAVQAARPIPFTTTRVTVSVIRPTPDAKPCRESVGIVASRKTSPATLTVATAIFVPPMSMPTARPSRVNERSSARPARRRDRKGRSHQGAATRGTPGTASSPAR